ncbi:hypothetical protein PPYR_10768 [Photinus pyralis]|uniref:Thioredoxin domain-containing protein n=1 Tax=Photinus pyralis TaxID=7054 RepID=A0A1Y1KCE9_PHOPY|nr:protein disulfide-isomerase-like [Photinus pyralis]XP_031348873.1 protein disulfide-isomerase-like [Photinus pyralis]KAB0796163.1 hypothetical protein PPYR_10224 [Photinus pyralis]KAB0796707.1 hypothetical protein PPYR_10768 [Photinus pyralis]
MQLVSTKMFEKCLMLLLCSLTTFITTSTSDGIKIESGILILDKDNFERAITGNEYIFVMFYAPWCKDSQELEPEFTKAAKETSNLKIPVKLAKINASDEIELRAKYHILGFPVLQLFRRGTPLKYHGNRNSKKIASWLKDQVRPSARELRTIQEATKTVIGEDMVIIGFFEGPSEQLKKFLKIADSFERPPFTFSFDRESRSKFGNASHPIVLFKNFDYNKAVFDEELTLENVQTFVKIESSLLITELNEKNADTIFQGQVQTFVLLFASKKAPTTDSVVELLKPFAREYRKSMTFLLINTDDKSNMDTLEFFKLRLQDTPTVVIASHKNNAEKYKMDAPLTGDNLQRFFQDFNSKRLPRFLLSEELKDDWNKSDVYTLVGSNFARVAHDPSVDVLVLFYGDECEKCGVWTDVFYRLGEYYRDQPGIIVGKINVDLNEFDKKPFRKEPEVLLYKKGDNRVVPYKGKPNFDKIIQFVNSSREESKAVKEEL